MALIMLVITGFISYNIYKYLRNRQSNYPPWQEDQNREEYKERRREYYYKQRQKARQMMDQYDLSDEEIERLIEEEFRDKP
jgi:hypothetical protein